jgi:hypothetical protein
MYMGITNISASGLRKAAAIKDKIEELQSELEKLFGSGGNGVGNGRTAPHADGRKKKRTMSAAARAKIGAAQRARWAKQKAGK